ncbi:GNAT family N-acetyltransferase [Pseudovibrio brasiliensis]|uniref:GNAT family N-acetyltransferase n=1 Tax=Pseudovibrio brasiliensis TaxID=1898042 RepID=A0ABX8AM87_9HYPH|nr:GNAT family protein [Pseudovibrio brasiliensis]QUS56178.1 GNAT family N-acetyltransferase [Pseudovibrio brasiliensis]
MFPELKTDRLTLRQFKHTDLEPLCTHINNFAVVKTLSEVPYPYSKEDGEWWINFCRTTPFSEKIAWVVEGPAGFSGAITLMKLQSGKPILGYWLAEHLWGKGYMSEAAEAVTAYGFETLKLPTIYTSALEENPASLRVLQKLGFREVGRGFSTPRSRQGETLPSVSFSLTKDQWAERLTIA